MSALILLCVCLLPGIIASARGHHNAGAIWAISILLGWTGLGWLVAFIWSLTSTRAYRIPQVVINNSNQLGQPPLINNQGSWYKGNLVEDAPRLTVDEQQVLQLYRRQRQEEANLATYGNLGGAGGDKGQPASQLAGGPVPEPTKPFLDGVKPLKPLDDEPSKASPPIDLRGWQPK
jgi:hypothetical protein